MLYFKDINWEELNKRPDELEAVMEFLSTGETALISKLPSPCSEVTRILSGFYGRECIQPKRIIARNAALFNEVERARECGAVPLRSNSKVTGAYARVADNHNMTEDAVEKVYKAFKRAVSREDSTRMPVTRWTED